MCVCVCVLLKCSEKKKKKKVGGWELALNDGHYTWPLVNDFGSELCHLKSWSSSYSFTLQCRRKKVAPTYISSCETLN